ncbi:MAG: Ig-like domain-containing protein [Ascidiaceihabitans sp.]|nr:Ig-like domain-containing protein [Ascidiaceihabitans sp.]
MKAIDFVVRDESGALQRGVIQAGDQTTTIQAGSDQEISLNLRQVDMQTHARNGDALNIVLADGRIIVIENYFNDDGGANRLFISADGYLNEVAFVETTDGGLYAQFGPTEQWGKWSPSDDLIYLGRTDIAALPVDDEVSMLAPLALLGGGGLGTAAAAAGVGAVVIGSGGGGGGGGSTPPAVPTVDDADGTPVVGGQEQPYSVEVTGTGEPGDTVTVTVGDQTGDTIIGDDGTWGVVLDGENLPSDGEWETIVVVDHLTGGNTPLDGPVWTIDTTAPEIEITDGIQATGDVFNGEELDGGAVISGTGEAGATLVVTVGEHTQTTTIGEDGSWTVTWPAGTFAAGEYTSEMTIVATDAIGNASTTTATIVIDTISEVTIETNTTAGDGTINAAEQAAGVTLTGTAQVGSTVDVTFGGTTLPAVVDSQGVWSVVFPSSAIATGEYDATVTAVATEANGNSATTTGTIHVDTISEVSVSTSTVAGDGTINGAEQAAGVTLTGTAQAGSTVDVTFGSTTLAATVDANGNWSVDFPPSAIATGEYEATVTAVATDANGNVSASTGTIQVDTFVNTFGYTSTSGGADGVINATEAQSGLIVTGNAEAGSTVSVVLGGVTQVAMVNADGSWTATYSASQLAPGTYSTDMVATATDAAGNTSTITQTVNVDTEAGSLTISSNPIETDDVINAVEASDGVVLSGTSDAGAIVQVTMGGVTHSVVTNPNGVWQANFAASEIAPGTYVADITATTTDAAGNVDSVASTVQVDTLVNQLNLSSAPVEGDNVVNQAEASDGINLSGQVEPGSTVMVDFEGTTLAANVDAAGNWSIAIPASAIAAGSYDADITVMATDAVGNTATISDTLAIDTDAPDGPVIASYTRDGDGIRGISTEFSADDLSVAQVNADGSITEVSATQIDIPQIGETNFSFNSEVPDGSHLIVSSTDSAGNASGTYVVLDDESANSGVDMSNASLGNYQIETVDLQFAEEAHLSITEAQLVGLADGTDTLTVKGGGDDEVTITGANQTGSITHDGQTYDVYSLGAGTVLIDDDITVNTGVIG